MQFAKELLFLSKCPIGQRNKQKKGRVYFFYLLIDYFRSRQVMIIRAQSNPAVFGSPKVVGPRTISTIFMLRGRGQSSFRESAGSLYIILKKGGIIYLPYYVLGEQKFKFSAFYQRLFNKGQKQIDLKILNGFKLFCLCTFITRL